MATNSDKKINLQKTINLPKTDFPMRANLAQNEPQSINQTLEKSKHLAAPNKACNPFMSSPLKNLIYSIKFATCNSHIRTLTPNL